MLVTKSNRITILPISNKNKLISLNNYFEKVLLTKNQISINKVLNQLGELIAGNQLLKHII